MGIWHKKKNVTRSCDEKFGEASRCGETNIAETYIHEEVSRSTPKKVRMTILPAASTRRATIAEIPPSRFKPAPERGILKTSPQHRNSAPPPITISSCQYCAGHRCLCNAPAVAPFQGCNPMYNNKQQRRWNSSRSRSPKATRSSNVLSQMSVFSNNSENHRPVDTTRSNVPRRSSDSNFLSKIAFFNGTPAVVASPASPAAASSKRLSTSRWGYISAEQRVKHSIENKYIAERSHTSEPEVHYPVVVEHPTLVELAPSSATRRRWVRGEDGWHSG